MTADYQLYERSPITDERFGDPDFEAWEKFDRSGVSKLNGARTLHLIHRSLGNTLDLARKTINRFTTCAYLKAGQSLASDATNNAKFYSEDKTFGSLYAVTLSIPEDQKNNLTDALRTPWGEYVASKLGTTSEAVIKSVFGSMTAPELRVVLTAGAVNNGYVSVPSDQSLFPAEYFGPSEESGLSTFSLALPNGEVVTTDIRSPTGKGGRIRQRFGALFKSRGVKPGDIAVLRQQTPSEYSLSFADEETGNPHVTPDRETPMPTKPLNQILYGPPGTGKTYATVAKALEILDPSWLHEHHNNRNSLRHRYEELRNQGAIEFVTFHQSFSYEDFVEGLKAVTKEDGAISYEIEDGVFKRICNGPETTDQVDLVSGTTLSNGRYRITYVSQDIVRIHIVKTGSTVSFDATLLNELARLVGEGRITIDDIRSKQVFDKVDTSLEKFIVNGYPGILAELVSLIEQSHTAASASSQGTRTKVLIIDEINRGNIASIFGELITLLEPSKRLGASESTRATLPYSKEAFGVPGDLHVIGTMNTADRSLVHVDTALRRRFTFIEVPPAPEELAGIHVSGINIERVLSVINSRIELIYDREHRIGHSYFLPLSGDPTLERLSDIFSDQILPLLEEYFFDDWSRIKQILREQGKPSSRFVKPKYSEDEIASLLGADADVTATVYEKSETGLLDPSAYISLYQATDSTDE